jgi:hypothetical protein
VSQITSGQSTQERLSDEQAAGVAELVDVDRTGELLLWLWSSLFNRPAERPEGRARQELNVSQRHSCSQQVVEECLLGGGCFWCVEAVLRRLYGVVAVASGYAGGNTPHPTYAQVNALSLCAHQPAPPVETSAATPAY